MIPTIRTRLIPLIVFLVLTMMFVTQSPVSAHSTQTTLNPHAAVSHSLGGVTNATHNNSSLPKPYVGTGVKTPQRLAPGHALQLPDIAEASRIPQGDGCSITVHNNDTRVRVKDTSVYPWRANADLEITTADGAIYGATAWFIGPHTLATAGHAVYIKNSGVPGRDGWVKSIAVRPGRDGDQLPYGSVYATYVHSVKGWTDSANEDYDYGSITLGTDLGKTVGWYGFGVYSDKAILSHRATISGYPCDKPSGTQWVASNKFDSVTDRRLFYQTATAGGDSGSSVYFNQSDGPYGMGIHTTGNSKNSGGTRINDKVFANLKNWRN